MKQKTTQNNSSLYSYRYHELPLKMAELWKSHSGSPAMLTAARQNFMTAAARRFSLRTWRGFGTNNRTHRNGTSMPTAQIFISYSHQDKAFREELEKNLKPYLRAGSITNWSDQQIAPGSQWFPEIECALENSKIAVLLVSHDFLASDFVHEHELGPVLEKAEEGGVKILWVPIRDSAYKKTPLKDYQAVVLDPSKPLASMTKARRDKAWVKICEEIEKAVSEVKTAKAISNIELKLGEQREDIQTIALLARAVH
jgi:hypothetical protein